MALITAIVYWATLLVGYKNELIAAMLIHNGIFNKFVLFLAVSPPWLYAAIVTTCIVGVALLVAWRYGDLKELKGE